MDVDDGTNKEPKEVSDDANNTDEQSITMLDVLKEEEEFEVEYAAVLGASDEKCCTYAEGPIKRQALYSCLTCCPEAKNDFSKSAGVCLACSYQCHENHELIELYTKRNFRCDCPSERMGTNHCRLNANIQQPAPDNTTNKYNQNFQGLYCKCHRPYPDPERTSEENMSQCSICEDWFHLQHLDAPTNAAKLMDECSEMICDMCMQQYEVLYSYSDWMLLPIKISKDKTEDVDVDISTISTTDPSCKDNDKLRIDLDKSISDILNMNNKAQNSESSKTESPPNKKQKLLDEINKETSTSAASICSRPSNKNVYTQGAAFWKSDWRKSLCRCTECLNLYKNENIEYLLDLEDTTASYEERGIKKAAKESSSYERGIQALASIDRSKQIDAITEYNLMKDSLKEYLHEFVVNKKIVTEEDINRFFSEMRKKRAAAQPIGQPFFCR